MKLSIIMPAYNAEKYIQQAIESILNQDFKDFELLIADDQSKDNTKNIISEYEEKDPRIKTFHNSENLGYLKTCNKLFALTTGDFITFQDADDWSERDRFSVQLNAFSNDPDLGLCGTCGNIVNENGEYIRDSIREQNSNNIKENLKHENQFIGASIMITRKVYEDFGGYIEFFDHIGWEDYDWAFRISEKYKCVNLSNNTYSYRQHPQSISKTISLRKHICKDIVIFLGQQRERYNGKDGVTCSDHYKELNEFIKNKELPYLKNPSLFYREKAAKYMNTKLYSQAIHSSIQSIKSSPTSLVNYRTLLYCIRKVIFK